MDSQAVADTLRALKRSQPALASIESRARQVVIDAGLDPATPGYREHDVDPRVALADLILRRMKILNTAVAEGNIGEIVLQSFRISQETGEHDFWVDHGTT